MNNEFKKKNNLITTDLSFFYSILNEETNKK
jgi:hypothetical protein